MGGGGGGGGEGEVESESNNHTAHCVCSNFSFFSEKKNINKNKIVSKFERVWGGKRWVEVGGGGGGPTENPIVKLRPRMS